jgi:hypothetical protein
MAIMLAASCNFQRVKGKKSYQKFQFLLLISGMKPPRKCCNICMTRTFDWHYKLTKTEHHAGAGTGTGAAICAAVAIALLNGM